MDRKQGNLAPLHDWIREKQLRRAAAIALLAWVAGLIAFATREAIEDGVDLYSSRLFWLLLFGAPIAAAAAIYALVLAGKQFAIMAGCLAALVLVLVAISAIQRHSADERTWEEIAARSATESTSADPILSKWRAEDKAQQNPFSATLQQERARGWRWAFDSNITDPEKCSSQSAGFEKGCRTYVAEQQIGH